MFCNWFLWVCRCVVFVLLVVVFWNKKSIICCVYYLAMIFGVRVILNLMWVLIWYFYRWWLCLMVMIILWMELKFGWFMYIMWIRFFVWCVLINSVNYSRGLFFFWWIWMYLVLWLNWLLDWMVCVNKIWCFLIM